MTPLKNVTLYRTGLILVLSAGVGMITIAPTAASAQATSTQDRSAQSQDKRQSGGQKPATGHANRGQRPAQQSRPQQQPRPQPGHNTRPGTRPSRPQPNRPQPGRPQPGHNNRPTPQPSRPGHNNGHNGRPTTRPNRPGTGRPQTRPNRPGTGRPQTRPNRPQNRPNYRFRSQDTSRLRQYYRGGFGRIDRRHRPRFYHGGYIPRMYWSYFQPVPYSLIGYLPAVPPGYAIGYYDGYVVVYDPTTYFILSVLDILQ